MEDLTKLITVLNKITPVTPKQTKTKLERASDEITKYMIMVALGLFLVLGSLALWHKMSPLPDMWKWVALIIGYITMILPIVSILIDICITSISMFRFKTDSLRLFLLEIKHDKENVERLTGFNRRVLEEAQVWLQLKSTRIKNRMGLFVGNSEKIALFSLAGFGWSIWKELSGKTLTTKLSLTSGDATQNILIWVTAFLTGIAIGAVLMNFQLRRYSYYLELIDLALSKKPKRLSPIK